MADEHFPYNLGMSLLTPLDPGMGSIFLHGSCQVPWLVGFDFVAACLDQLQACTPLPFYW